MKDYFTPEYHDMRAKQEDHARRLTAAMIDYVEDTQTNLEVIAERWDISQSALSDTARKYVREEFLRKRGVRPQEDIVNERTREIVYLLREGTPILEIAETCGVSRQYVYQVRSRYLKEPAE
jgi:DNA-directed RNA polymerase specialized sigma subunit